jgi:predicted transcriptional regulator of viral defense system
VQTLTESVLQQGLGNKVLTDAQLQRVLESSPAARYALVNRALKANELIRIRRGLYTLSPHLRTEPVHPFGVAQAIVHGSYVSFETALSHHGWIPESVRVVASVVPARKSLTIEHPMQVLGKGGA